MEFTPHSSTVPCVISEVLDFLPLGRLNVKSPSPEEGVKACPQLKPAFEGSGSPALCVLEESGQRPCDPRPLLPCGGSEQLIVLNSAALGLAPLSLFFSLLSY